MSEAVDVPKSVQHDSPDYARNFICDFIIGKEQEHTERTLFDL